MLDLPLFFTVIRLKSVSRKQRFKMSQDIETDLEKLNHFNKN